jgi:two-component system, sensor histidine kinase and response regulator
MRDDPELRRATVMVVEDIAESLRLLEAMLTKQGYRVLPFLRGDQALEAAQKEAPDLVLLDIGMPDMDGFEVCRRLKANDDLKDVAVIFITAKVETVDKVRAFEVGGVDYVTKPFHFEEVRACVETHLKLRDQRLELQDQFGKLQELEQLRDSLVHMVVHDMRSSLTGIIGYLDIFEEHFGDRLTEEEMGWIRQTKITGSRLTAMANELLDVSRLEAGEMPVSATECDVAALAREVVDSHAEHIRSMAIQASAPDCSLTALCDAGLIRRVITNLVGNALDYSPQGGALLVQVSGESDDVRVTVSDDGPGIPAEQQVRIFDKFGQAEGKRRGGKHSTGLGLAFCKLAVDAHSGTLGVDSVVGKGSTFWFVIPATDHEER